MVESGRFRFRHPLMRSAVQQATTEAERRGGHAALAEALADRPDRSVWHRAAMGAAMVSLVGHAHDGCTPAATAWVLCAGAAVVLGATMLVAATLKAWRRDPGLYRPLAGICAAVAVACLGVGAVRPAPLFLGITLIVLLSTPWVFAVVHRLAHDADTPLG